MAAEQLKIVSQTTIFPLGEISNFTPKGKDTPPTVPPITQKHRQPTPQPTPLTAGSIKHQTPPCEGFTPTTGENADCFMSDSENGDHFSLSTFRCKGEK